MLNSFSEPVQGVPEFPVCTTSALDRRGVCKYRYTPLPIGCTGCAGCFLEGRLALPGKPEALSLYRYRGS